MLYSDFLIIFQLSLQRRAIRSLGSYLQPCHARNCSLFSAVRQCFLFHLLQVGEFRNSPKQLSYPQDSSIVICLSRTKTKSCVACYYFKGSDFLLFKEVFVSVDQVVSPFSTHVSVIVNLNCFHWFKCFSLLLLVIVEEIGLTPQGEKSGNAEKLAEYICSSKYLKSST